MFSQKFTLYPTSPNEKLLGQIAHRIKGGALVIYPTDTVYAFGCSSHSKSALDSYAKLKKIKLEQAPLSFLFKDMQTLSKYVAPMDSATFKILKKNLPGPYTFILEAAKKLPRPFQKRKTIGVRISNHPILKSLFSFLDAPLVTSSLHDEDVILDYMTDPELIFDVWQDKIDVMIDSGYGGNKPSTVIDLTVSPYKILRAGKGDWIEE